MTPTGILRNTHIIAIVYLQLLLCVKLLFLVVTPLGPVSNAYRCLLLFLVVLGCQDSAMFTQNSAQLTDRQFNKRIWSPENSQGWLFDSAS